MLTKNALLCLSGTVMAGWSIKKIITRVLMKRCEKANSAPKAHSIMFSAVQGEDFENLKLYSDMGFEVIVGDKNVRNLKILKRNGPFCQLEEAKQALEDGRLARRARQGYPTEGDYVLIPKKNMKQCRAHPLAGKMREVMYTKVLQETLNRFLVNIGPSRQQIESNSYNFMPVCNGSDDGHYSGFKIANTTNEKFGIVPTKDEIRLIKECPYKEVCFVMVHSGYYIHPTTLAAHMLLVAEKTGKRVSFCNVLNFYPKGAKTGYVQDCPWQIRDDGKLYQYTGKDRDLYIQDMKITRLWTDYMTYTRCGLGLTWIAKTDEDCLILRGILTSQKTTESGKHSAKKYDVFPLFTESEVFSIPMRIHAALKQTVLMKGEDDLRVAVYSFIAREKLQLPDYAVDELVKGLKKREYDGKPREVGVAVNVFTEINAIAQSAWINESKNREKTVPMPIRILDDRLPKLKQAPYCYNNTSHNVDVAIRNRGLMAVKPYKKHKELRDEIVGQLVVKKRNRKPLSRVEFIQDAEPKKRKALVDTGLLFEDDDFVPDPKPKYLAFVKTEMTNDLDLSKKYFSEPRIIQAPTEHTKLEVGRHINRISKWLMKHWNIYNEMCYAAGNTPIELGLWRLENDKVFGDHTYLETDFSRWDAHYNEDFIKTECECYNKFGKHFRAMAIEIWKNRNFRGMTSTGSEYGMKGTRRSGDPQTSVGNSLINGLYHKFIFDKLLGSGNWRAIFMGDDMLVAIRKGINIDLKLYIRFWRNLGMVPETLIPEMYKESFCSQYFWNCSHNGEDTYVLAAKPGRLLGKLGYAVGPQRKTSKDREMFGGTINSLLPGLAVVPGFKMYLKKFYNPKNDNITTNKWNLKNHDITLSDPNILKRTANTERQCMSLYGMTMREMDEEAWKHRDRAYVWCSSREE
jgi:hypothetical protein